MLVTQKARAWVAPTGHLKPSSLASWAPALSTLQAGGSGLMIPNIADAYYGTPIPTGAENEAGVRAYQSGRFFAEGWWNNPFQPDLI